MKRQQPVLALVLAATLLGTVPPARAADRPVTGLDAVAGKKLYLRECAACHGPRGDGKGPAAAFLDPKPRDFTRRVFKIRTTASGQPPTTQDLLKTLELGLPGSAMPSFTFLSAEERKKIVAHVLHLADLLDKPEPAMVPDPGPPPPVTPELLARGKQVYTTIGCFKCHGDTGRGDGPSAPELTDEQDRPIKVRDFTSGIFRGGSTVRDVHDRMVTGMNGTPMPSFGDVIPQPDRWALVHYLMALKAPPVVVPPPSDPIAAGRALADKFGCRGCHVLDDGKGGNTGPDLRVSGAKLLPTWVRGFLKAPREAGKIYPWREARMPDLKLSDAEVETAVKYLGTMGKRPASAADTGSPIKLVDKPGDEGQNMYVLRCSQCHALGHIVQTPLASQQGPDLINVAKRVDFEWARSWISDPRKIDPRTRMLVTDITPAQILAVRDFLWRTAQSVQGSPGGGR